MAYLGLRHDLLSPALIPVLLEPLRDLDQREVCWVSRAKQNMAYKVKKTLTKGVKGLLKDQLIVLQGSRI